MKLQYFTSTCAALLIANGSAMAAPELRPMCTGTYTIYSGTIEGQSGSQTHFIQNKRSQGKGTLDVRKCGREMVLDSEFELLLNQSILNDAEYHGELNMGGVTREFTFTSVNPRKMTGIMQAGDGELSLKRGLELVYQSGSAPDLQGCSDDSAPPGPNRKTSVAETQIASAFNSIGLNPDTANGYSFDDYVWQATSDGETAWVSFQLGSSGSIIPVKSEISLEEICSGEAGKLDVARQILSFKIFRLEDSTHVFAQLIDLETGKILQQQEGVEDSTSDSAVKSAGLKALKSMTALPTRMSDGKL